MKVVERTLVTNEGSAPGYFTINNLSFGRYNSAFTQEQNRREGIATFNNAAKDILFPKDGVSPFKAYSAMVSQVGSGHCNISLIGDNSIIHSENSNHLVNHTFEKFDIEIPAVKNLTKRSELKYRMQPSGSLTVARIVAAQFTLYYYQYECAADLTSDNTGNITVSVSDKLPYIGDSVTFSAKIPDGGNIIWDGWYSDKAGTQLVTKDLDYTTPASDITLYAKSFRIAADAFYIKENGAWSKKSKAYEKVNGIWEQINYTNLKEKLSKGNFILNDKT